jgi:hypothetical protein
MSRRLLPIVLVSLLLASPSYAGIFFGKKADKPNPKDRVPELLRTVLADGDENKRVAAAEELRQYDAAQFPDIVPTLITVLLNDKKPGVRAEAAQTLGRMRPMSPSAVQALEAARDKDSSMRVRMQARSSLLNLHWSGYRNKKDEPPTKEPPLVDPHPQTPAPTQPPASPNRQTPRLTPVPQPSQPPIRTTPPTQPSQPQQFTPMPQDTTTPPISTTPGVQRMPNGPEMPTTPPARNEGPALPPPQ